MASHIEIMAAGTPPVAWVSEKDEQIETMRGLACVLLVAFHVVGHDAAHGMQVELVSWYRYLADASSPLRLPLFTFIAGMVYTIRPVNSSNWRAFVLGKSRRLVIPLLVVTTLLVIARSSITGEPWPSLNELWPRYAFSYEHLWYLQALLLIFFAITVIETRGWLAYRRGWLLIIVVSLGLYFSRSLATQFFSFTPALYLWSFFLSGLALARFASSFASAAARNWSVGLSLTLTVVWLAQMGGQIYLPPPIVDLLVLALGVSAAVTLKLLGFRLRPLAVIGGYSYTIYLYHIFGLAAARELTVRFVGDHHLLLFVPGLFAGIALPIIGHRLIKNSRLPRLLFLGRRY